MSYELKLENDGVAYVNVYSKGRTALGKMLSNFHPFKFKQSGKLFANIEALWVYLGIHPDDDNRDAVCMMPGVDAKKAGRRLRDPNYRDPEFHAKILAAVRCKLEYYATQTPEIFLAHANLPLEHYYSYSGKVIDLKAEFAWLIDGVNQIRTEITDRLLLEAQKNSGQGIRQPALEVETNK
jgi:hypothetical protein